VETGPPSCSSDLSADPILKPVERVVDLFVGSAVGVDLGDLCLEICPGDDSAQYFVTRPEDPLEQPDLVLEKVIDSAIGHTAPVDEIADDHIELLADPMASADSLLDPLRVPWQVVVDDQIAELKVQALCPRLRREQDGCRVAEVGK